MKTLFTMLLLLCATNALAQSCPDYSGKYANGEANLLIKQTECRKVETAFSFQGVTKSYDIGVMSNSGTEQEGMVWKLGKLVFLKISSLSYTEVTYTLTSNGLQVDIYFEDAHHQVATRTDLYQRVQ